MCATNNEDVELVSSKGKIRRNSVELRVPMEKAIERYNNGESMTALAKEYKVTMSSLREAMRRAGNHIRNGQEFRALLPQNQRKYQVNDDYFKTESSNMAWLLGFLGSDGYVTKQKMIGIRLAEKDSEILGKIKEEIKADAPVKHYTNKDGFDYCQLTWTSHPMLDDLKQYNIVPQKTFKFAFPTKLDKKYWIDFIRGYFDGDGSINIVQGKALRWQVCGATKSTLETIVNFLYDAYQIPKVSILEQKTKNNNTLYYFQYSTKATQKIFEILYTPNSLRLERKYLKFKEVLEQHENSLKK